MPGMITFVIPCMNRLYQLKETLESYVKQTVPAEVVVVDYGSGDGCADWVESHYPDVVVVRTGARDYFNLEEARNIGGKKAMGCAFVAHSDADVSIAPNFVEKMSPILRDNEFYFCADRGRGRAGFVIFPGKEHESRGFDENMNLFVKGYGRADDEMLWHLDKTRRLYPRSFPAWMLSHLDGVGVDHYLDNDHAKSLARGSEWIRRRYRGVYGDAIYHPEWGRPVEFLPFRS